MLLTMTTSYLCGLICQFGKYVFSVSLENFFTYIFLMKTTCLRWLIYIGTQGFVIAFFTLFFSYCVVFILQEHKVIGIPSGVGDQGRWWSGNICMTTFVGGTGSHIWWSFSMGHNITHGGSIAWIKIMFTLEK